MNDMANPEKTKEFGFERKLLWMLGSILFVVFCAMVIVVLKPLYPEPSPLKPKVLEPAVVKSDASEPMIPNELCGDCASLCRLDAFDRASGIPDSLISCALSESIPGVALVTLRSMSGPKIWVVAESLMIPAEETIFNEQGLDIKLALVDEAKRRWPWLFDRIYQPGENLSLNNPSLNDPLLNGEPSGNRVAEPSQPPAAPSQELAGRADSPWVLFATEDAMAGVFGQRPDISGDVREATAEEIEGVVNWISGRWPSAETWTHMAWIDPQCPHCARLHETGLVEHYAPRIVLNRTTNPEKYQQAVQSAGWLMQDVQEGTGADMEKFLALEPASDESADKAARAQEEFDALLYTLREDWNMVVPVQLKWGDGWLFIWLGASPAPNFIPA